MKKRVMLIGPRKSGKTTLANYLEERKTEIRQPANLIYGAKTLDTPGAYLECPWMYHHLIASQQDAFCVWLLLSAETRRRSYPPHFAQAFRVPVYGIFTFFNQTGVENDYKKSILEFEQAGVVGPYYQLDLADKEQALTLMQQLTSVRKEEL